MLRRLLVGVVCVAGCASAADIVEITEVSPSELPQSVVQVIASERPDFKIVEVLKKVRDGRVYYDVEGELADKSELEFDVLMDGQAANIVEIQRDLEWEQVPSQVQTAALTASNGKVPVRIIESKQVDQSIIYELFAEDDPSDPAMEVRSDNGEVEVLGERWPH